MPSFWPMIKANAPVIIGALLFVGVIHFIAFVVRRWKNV